MDPSVPLGTPTFSDGFLNVAFNLDFSEERVVIEYFAFDGEPSGTTILTPRFEGGLVELAPPPGMDHIDLPPGESAKASATLRPGPVEDDCASMALDIQLDASGPGPDVLALAVHRGRICLLDPIDAADGVCGGEPTRPCDELPECCVLIDACAGDEAPTTCE